MFMTTIVKKTSLRGIVMTYVLADPGNETVVSIVDDLVLGYSSRDRLFKSVYQAVLNLRQRGLLYYGEGKKREHKKLYPVEGAADCLV